MKQILVVGSLNMDTVIETPHMPKCGETIAGKSVEQIPGGKGANQAYAAGKLGGKVAMLGAVGDDTKGQQLLDNLDAVNVDVSHVEKLKEVPTGQAYITVDSNGDNAIIIIAGANGEVNKELIRENRELIRRSDIIVMQLEIPLEVVQYVKELAAAEGKMIILDPAPARRDIPESLWNGIDFIKPNETEIGILTGTDIRDQKERICAARELIRKGVKNVIVTLGGEGCIHVTADTEEFFPAHQVKTVDTTAAGDCFTAAFALALSQGKTCKEAISFGQKASAIAVTRKGAQTSIPTLEEIREYGGD